MRTQRIGSTALLGSRLAYGCWRLAGTWDPAAVTSETMAAGRRAVAAAYEAGFTLFDNADIYCQGVCETIFGQAMREISGMRDEIIVVTKCGIRPGGDPMNGPPGRYDSSAEHIVRSCEASLKRMGIERIDLLLIHRPDFLMDPAEVAAAFDGLRLSGKVREFGVSNFTPAQVSSLSAACPMKLVVNQLEIHLGRLDALSDGALDQCLAQNITPMAWSPLGGGILADGPAAPFADSPLLRKPPATLAPTLDLIAEELNVSRADIALAWLLRHPAGIMPIFGSIRVDRIKAAPGAMDVPISRVDWYRVLIAARGEPLP